MGKVYIQSVLDCHSRHAWARLYTSKLPVTAVHILNEAVLPFFEDHGAVVSVVLSDNGREFCGRPDHHPYELFLQLEGTSTGRPHFVSPRATGSSSGSIARFSMSISE